MPGSRFTIWGADCHLEFPKGSTSKQVQFLLNWIQAYLVPLGQQEDAKAAADADAPPLVLGDDAPAIEVAPDKPTEEVYTGPKPITSFPFIKRANGDDRGGFKPEDYEKNNP